MEGMLGFLERMVLIVIGIFALYQSFQVQETNTGAFSRPAAGWAARLCLIALAGICFFAFAHSLATT